MKHNQQLRIYGEAMNKAAVQRNCPFIDMHDLLGNPLENQSGELRTDNGIHLTARGYLRAAEAIEQALGLAPRKVRIEQFEKLRQTIIAKNRLYFDRWRPQNWTYILGFRKGEQGRNAVEIPQFDPLVETKETEIAKLRRSTAVDSPTAKPSNSAQPAPIQKDPNAPDPEEERKTFQV